MVLVVEPVARLALGQVEQVAAGGEDLAARENSLPLLGPLQLDAEQLFDLGKLRTELAVQLVAADPGEVVPLGIEEGVLEVSPRRFGRRRLAGPGPLVDLEECFLLGRSQLPLLFPLPLEEVEVADKALEEGLVAIPQGPQEHEQGEPTLPGDARPGRDVLPRLGLDVEFDPFTPVGMDRP